MYFQRHPTEMTLIELAASYPSRLLLCGMYSFEHA